MVLTGRGPTCRVSYNKGSYIQIFLQPGVFIYRGLTTTGSYSEGSYIREFLQPGVLHLGVLTSGVLRLSIPASKGSYGPYDQGFLQPRVLHLIVVETRGSNRQGSYNQGSYNQQHRQESLHLLADKLVALVSINKCSRSYTVK